jgi:Uma2 family endonuclease
VSLEEFARWAELPENADHDFELINGEVIAVTPARTPHSFIHNLIVVAVHNYCNAQKLPCYTTSGDGSYGILGNVIAPDFAYKSTPLLDYYPDPEPPLWAVEIVSPNDKANEIRDKREIYQQAGILYWEIYPKARSVDIYAPGEPVRTVGMGGTLDGGVVLPGFTLPVRELFPAA